MTAYPKRFTIRLPFDDTARVSRDYLNAEKWSFIRETGKVSLYRRRHRVKPERLSGGLSAMFDQEAWRRIESSFSIDRNKPLEFEVELSIELHCTTPRETEVEIVGTLLGSSDIRYDLIGASPSYFLGDVIHRVQIGIDKAAHQKPRNETEKTNPTRKPDVFLSYNSTDKAEVEKIARQLLGRGVKPYFDLWELRPGVQVQPELEENMLKSKAAAVFVGRSGIGPWQRDEMYAMLREQKRRGVPVIPVLLPSAPVQPKLPLFLSGNAWVDYRSDPLRSFEQLIWGITGKRRTD